MSDLLTTEEAADLLRINAKRVQALARSGKLPALRTGRRWLFRRADLLRALRTEPAGGEPSAVETSAPVSPPGAMSARNQLRGRVVDMIIEGLMAEVHVAVGDQTLVAVITRSSAERLGLERGKPVVAIIKSTEVIVALPS